MSITIENSFEPNDPRLSERAHFIPCRIDADGEASVKKYFENYVEKSNDGSLSGTFRGRPLDGVEVKLPNDFKAILLTESKRPLNDNAERKLQVSSGFNTFTYWNWDRKPSANDSLTKALDWVDISEALHSD